MYVYWHEDLGITRNKEDMESMCSDAQGRLVVWPEDMGWEEIEITLPYKSFMSWWYGEWDTAMYEADKAGV